MTPLRVAAPFFEWLVPYVAAQVGRAFALTAAGKACRQTWPWRALSRADRARGNDYYVMVRQQVANELDARVRAKVKEQIREKMDELARQNQFPTADATISLDSMLHAVCDHPDHRVDPCMGRERKEAEFVHEDDGEDGGDDGVRVVTVDTAATTDVLTFLPDEGLTNTGGGQGQGQARGQEQGQEQGREQGQGQEQEYPAVLNPNKPAITLTDTTINGRDYKLLTWSYTVHMPLEEA